MAYSLLSPMSPTYCKLGLLATLLAKVCIIILVMFAILSCGLPLASSSPNYYHIITYRVHLLVLLFSNNLVACILYCLSSKCSLLCPCILESV